MYIITDDYASKRKKNYVIFEKWKRKKKMGFSKTFAIRHYYR